MIAFKRTALAQELVAALQGKALLGDAHNGLFLAAPRRTGKSTFLQGDLSPALQAAGVVVVYVDLWADVRRDPGGLIAGAIARALGGCRTWRVESENWPQRAQFLPDLQPNSRAIGQKDGEKWAAADNLQPTIPKSDSLLEPHLGLVARAAKNAGLDKVKVGGLEVDTSKIGKVDGMTLNEALRLLHESAGKPVALIIDEAQHALTSEAGETAMTALKSARDQLNRPGAVNLMLVMSGSDRDKLLRLVNTAAAPFYGSQIQRMPSLGPDFIGHVAGLIEAQRPSLQPVDQALLLQAFEAFGHRPQFFMAALGQVLSPLADVAGRFEPALLQAAWQQQAQDEVQMASDYLGLKPTEQAVLWRMLEQGPRYRPYDAEALRFYREKTGRPVTVTQAQKALEALRQRMPALVWKSARGEYALEDAAMHRWFDHLAAAGKWPPSAQQEYLPFEED